MAHDVIFFGCLRTRLDFNQQNPLRETGELFRVCPMGDVLQKSGGYTLTARLLHWLTAVLVLFQIPAGLLIANFEMGPALRPAQIRRRSDPDSRDHSPCLAMDASGP